jgi:hypothetical protein
MIPRQLLLVMFLLLSHWRSSVVIRPAGLNPQIGTNSFLAAGQTGQAGIGSSSCGAARLTFLHFGLSRYTKNPCYHFYDRLESNWADGAHNTPTELQNNAYKIFTVKP